MPVHHAPRRLAALAVVLSAALTMAVSAPGSALAAAEPLSTTDQVVHDELGFRAHLKALGPDLAGLVTDAETGQVLWGHHPFERQIPASNTKLVTAVNALATFGPDYRIRTSVVRGSTPHRVVLVGNGDPSLSRRNLRALATATASTVLAGGVRRVKVYVDDSLFPAPSLAFGWRSSYVPRDVRAVRALVVNQHQSRDTSLDAGHVLAVLLERQGLKVRKVLRAAAEPDAETLASVSGQPLATMIGTMLRESDNDYAEAFHRLVAIKAGFAPTWDGARLAQRQVLATLGVDLDTSTLYDGSGLSRADRLTPMALVDVLSLVFDGTQPSLAPMQHDALAIAGLTGTLGARYLRYTSRPTNCAVGLIEAKTGSLRGVISLSGFAKGADGRVKLFSFLLNKVSSTLTTRRAVDKLAATITGCW